MVRISVFASLLAALICNGATAGTITPIEGPPEHNLQSFEINEGTEKIGPAALFSHSPIPILEPDEPLKLLSDLKLGGEIRLFPPINLGTDNPWLAGLSPQGNPAKFIAMTGTETTDSGIMAPAQLAAIALGGIGLLCVSVLLWRRSVKRARRRSGRRRRSHPQTA